PPATSTLSLHDALPICQRRWTKRRGTRAGDTELPLCHINANAGIDERIVHGRIDHAPIVNTIPAANCCLAISVDIPRETETGTEDRKSTRLNSSHVSIS